MISALVGMGIRWRVHALKSERTRLEKEVENRTREIESDKQIIASQAEELKQLDIAKTHFFSNITHEFRTPLTLIIGPLEQLITSPPPPTIFKRRLQGVLKNARHILVLINQLLDISKIESGQMKVELVKGDIVDYTRELINRFQSMSKNKGQKLYFLADKKSWFINFDNKKWDKIIYNLLSNAIKFTPEGKEIQVSLTETCNKDESNLKLIVRDSGIGIPEDQLGHIFDRFYQVDHSATREQQGTGIGLSLVKELIQLQNGTIEVFSEVGKGTTFEILLPIPKTEGAESLIGEFPVKDHILFENNIMPPAEDQTLKTPVKDTLEVLIVEDNEEMREYIHHCLSGQNYKITEASNGEEGLEIAMTIIPDLVISDVMMPKKDGFELTETLRKNTSTSHIPIILLTAKSSLESKIQGLKRGADLYLTKPFSPEELIIQVEKLIGIRKVLQQRYQNNIMIENSEIYLQEDEFIVKLRSFILSNISDPDLNGDKIGSHFALSRVHLYRKLKALTNLSISEYVKNMRLEKARELLKENKLNVSEIADLTGFSSVSLFSRSFKQTFGHSPSKM
jgi:signal transduction histidine kinase/CheY-like chemotaxis protein/AraC-like DNA-binding protein